MTFFSTSLTVLTTKQPVTQNKIGVNRVKQATIVVRSMGTATYIALGGADSQDRRLTVVGASVSISALEYEKFIMLNEVFCSSDTADGVLEVFGDTYEGN